ncbi:hypothetical protein [Kitasatospora phosalacinea]|uniref:Uncharacterized protein n=1 Tax=Kitasatospora phosalacinea TaxID=2065 RepID=A0A9W6PJY5_9ACTN|nr:hypothetical protein [Kitasatospora phosalacinea]GLW56207.1 hypothetical protein Kpho01_42180 [Kitasatospora phosalacinea]
MDNYDIHVGAARQLLTEAHRRYNGRFTAEQAASFAQVEALLALAAAIRTHPGCPAPHHAAAQAAAITAGPPARSPE